LFGEEYIKYKAYFSKDQFLFIKGQVKQRENRWAKSTDTVEKKLEFNISSIQLLSDVREKMAKGVTVIINYKDVTPELIVKLDDVNNNTSRQGYSFDIYLLDTRTRNCRIILYEQKKCRFLTSFLLI
jgi:DNA polymerase-3 subunit alpha